MRKVALIGPGRLGQSVARLLVAAGYDLRAIIGRDQKRTEEACRFAGCPSAASTDLARAAEGELVLFALPDDRLAEMAKMLRRERFLAPGAVLVHFSGLHPASVLQTEEELHPALSLHPLQTFADAESGAESLPGSPFSVEGTDDLLPLGKKIVRDLGGIPFRIAGHQKALYHAAACIASNYQVALAAAAREVMAACGFGEQEAFALLAPIIETTSKNLLRLGPEAALTGPIARGDLKTVQKHLQALGELPEDVQELYRVMGRKTVEVAKKKGTLDAGRGEEIHRTLAEGY